jgi:DNA-binding transcriptional MerR regulator
MEFYSIGEVSKLCNIPVKTLRYYDEIGLLKPEYISQANNYRYYTKENTLKIPLIKYFKQLGFKLEDIKRLMFGLDIDELDLVFAKELEVMERQIEDLKKKHFAIKEWRTLLKQGEGVLTTDRSYVHHIDVQNIPLYRTIHYRYKLEDHPGANDLLYSNLVGEICNRNNMMAFGPFMLYFESIEQRINHTYTEMDCYTSVIGNDSDSDSTDSTVEIGDFQAVTAIHKGSYDTLTTTYHAALDWAADRGIPLQGTALERNIIDSWSTYIPEHFVTELILPIS